MPASRYIALLRAINVGGHVVKMDRLRGLFESFKCSNVSTFIASGNVIFDSRVANASALETSIEAGLARALGYPVATFLRSPDEMREAADDAAFTSAPPDASVYVMFLKTAPTRQQKHAVKGMATALDEYDVRRREVYWLRRNYKARAGEPGPAIERVLTGPATMRNLTTVRKLAAKYCAGPNA
jgi:uncharacterized protein (DUF1697 family)